MQIPSPALKPMREEEIEMRDKRAAALHEAAHAVIAERFGGAARPHICPSQAADPLQLKTWTGNCHILARPGSFPPGAMFPQVLQAPPHALVLVGLAGVTAEILDGQHDSDIALEELRAVVDLGDLSETDKAMAGEGVLDEWLEEVIEHVQVCWGQIEARADQLQQFPQSAQPTDL